MIGSVQVDAIRRGEGGKLVATAAAQVQASRDRVASSIGRLLITGLLCSSGDTGTPERWLSRVEQVLHVRLGLRLGQPTQGGDHA